MVLSHDVKSQLARFLAEDVGSGDVTSALLPKKQIRARVVSREDAVLAGTAHARDLFGMVGCSAEILRHDGSRVRPGQTVMTVAGDAADILTCERTALNLLARMSGIATQTDLMVSRIPDGTLFYATRKTAPGLRYFDKEAVQAGGGMPHRFRLDEMVMIKDNHIAAAGSLLSLIREARRRHEEFEVEVENTADAVLAAGEGAAIVMLDNFTPDQIKETIKVLKDRGLRDGVRLEASGGITQDNISGYAGTGVDIISAGSVTNSVRCIDMSLEV